MKVKNFKYFSFFLLAFLLFANVTLAVPLANPLGEGVNFEAAVQKVINTALGISGVLALISFVWGGTNWAISAGDPGKIQKGKTMMIWAIIGLVVIFSSYSILTYVFSSLLPDSAGNGMNIAPN